MKRLRWAVAAVLIACGCTPEPTPPAVSTTESEREELRSTVEVAEDENQDEPEAIGSPTPVIELPTPPGWGKSETRELPAEDHGYSVAYQHESGLTVTLYQFTRGLASIPDNVDSPLMHEQIDAAKSAIQEAVKLGYWSSARELDSKIVRLGDSPQQALWSLFELTVEDHTAKSEIYVWTRDNVFFKVRSTSRAEEDPGDALTTLLTALGDAPAAAR